MRCRGGRRRCPGCWTPTAPVSYRPRLCAWWHKRWGSRSRRCDGSRPPPARITARPVKSSHLTLTAEIRRLLALWDGNASRVHAELVQRAADDPDEPTVPSLSTLHRAIRRDLTRGKRAGLKNRETARPAHDVFGQRPTTHHNTAWKGDPDHRADLEEVRPQAAPAGQLQAVHRPAVRGRRRAPFLLPLRCCPTARAGGALRQICLTGYRAPAAAARSRTVRRLTRTPFSSSTCHSFMPWQVLVPRATAPASSTRP